MYDDVITLYNIVDDIGYRTVIKGVHIEPNTGVAVEGTGMKENDTMLCLIPLTSFEKKYINWKDFKKLSDEEKANYFTFKNGDKIVNGEIDFEITNQKPNTIAELERNNIEVFTITNFILRKLTNSKLNHFEITGK